MLTSLWLVLEILDDVHNGPVMPLSWHRHCLMGIPVSRIQMMMIIPRMIREGLYHLMRPQRRREIAPCCLDGTHGTDAEYPELAFVTWNNVQKYYDITVSKNGQEERK